MQKTLKPLPDLLVLDVTMPEMDGFTAARKIEEAAPRRPVLMLSMHVGAEMVRASKRVGADGWVTKSEVSDVLLPAVDPLLSGQTFFPDGDCAGAFILATGLDPNNRRLTQRSPRFLWRAIDLRWRDWCGPEFRLHSRKGKWFGWGAA